MPVSEDPPPQRYAFGDSDLAIERLDLLASLFAQEFELLLRRAAPLLDGIDSAIDLGCGPGHTTRALVAVFNPRATVGLDASPRMTEVARERLGGPAVTFEEHDVTAAPLPGAPADVIVARLLLTHLAEPAAAIRLWLSQLRPGGLLLLDEVEAIETSDPTIATYLQLSEELLAARGSGLYFGRDLDAAVDAERVMASIAELQPISNRDVARMFSLNLPSWRNDPVVAASHDASELDAIESGLAALTHSTEGVTTWTMRQLILRRD